MAEAFKKFIGLQSVLNRILTEEVSTFKIMTKDSKKSNKSWDFCQSLTKLQNVFPYFYRNQAAKLEFFMYKVKPH